MNLNVGTETDTLLSFDKGGGKISYPAAEEVGNHTDQQVANGQRCQR